MASDLDSDVDDSTNFQTEISKMMYGFGDCPNPNPDTVLLIESIVLQQLRSLLKEAYQVSVERGKNIITNYELIYIMHANRNVIKMKRLQVYQLAQDKISMFTERDKIAADEEDDVTETNYAFKKRTHIDIIQKLDKNGEVNNIHCDYIGRLRMIRAQNVTDAMSSDQYRLFHEARCTSFRTGKHGYSKFKQWVNPKNKYKISSSGLEVLSFIAYETVADIIDSVLLIRQKSPKGLQGYSYQLDNGVSVQWAIDVMEMHEALTKYFTPRVWLNSLFYKELGLEYLFNN